MNKRGKILGEYFALLDAGYSASDPEMQTLLDKYGVSLKLLWEWQLGKVPPRKKYRFIISHKGFVHRYKETKRQAHVALCGKGIASTTSVLMNHVNKLNRCKYCERMAQKR